MVGEAPVANVVRFAAFEVDLRTGELRKHGVRIKLQDQPFQILAMLLERPGELLTREQIQQKLWPADTFVDFDHSVNTAIRRLRDALGDDADTPRFIETLPRRGYRFIGTVAEPEHGAPAAAEPTAPVVVASTPVVALGAGRGHRSRYAMLAAGVLLLAVATLVAVRWMGLGERWFPPPIRSLVVLPLVNLSGDKEQEYFADGMTEALISELARVRGLRVVSRTSAMQFKGTHEGVPAIARRVNVDGVLEASVMRAGDRVRIRAQLVHAATDKPVWVGTYDRDLRNILALQTEVAQAIAQAIRLEITPAELARRVRARPVDPEAHQHYLVGLYYYQRQGQTPEGRERSREELQKAIDRDPNYAEAYVLLAENYWLSPGHAQDMPKAKAAALKAIELDDSLAMAHIALMKVRLFHDWDWAGAKAEGKRALELQPGLAAVHSNMSYLYWALGSVDDAVVEAQRAFDLDPLSIGATTQLARAYYFARQFDQSVKQSRSAIALDANDFWTHFYLSITLVHLGREAEAVEEFIAAERAGDVEGRELADAMEREYRRSGARAALRLQATTWERWAEAGRAQASSVAQTYAQMGEVDKAFSWLDRAYAQRSRSLLYLQTDPQFDSLRSDPRYQALVRKIGLPPLPAPSRQ